MNKKEESVFYQNRPLVFAMLGVGLGLCFSIFILFILLLIS